jgi:hypothetical protein
MEPTKLKYTIELEIPAGTSLQEAESFWIAVRAVLNGKRWDGWKASIKRRSDVYPIESRTVYKGIMQNPTTPRTESNRE